MNAPELDEETKAHQRRAQAAVRRVALLEEKACDPACQPERLIELIRKMAREIVLGVYRFRDPVLEAIAATNIRERLLARGVVLLPEPPVSELEAGRAEEQSP